VGENCREDKGFGFRRDKRGVLHDMIFRIERLETKVI
jgi:hypothetical protein